jgi:hypothetical protein
LRPVPVAYLKDCGSELQKAADLLELQGLASPCIDDISHAAANMLKHYYQHHPAFERFLSACGRVSGQLKQTLLACLAPPTVRTKARFMHVHRLFSWADRLLKLSPAGGAKAGSILVLPAGITQRVPLAVMSRTWQAIWFSCMSTEWVWDADRVHQNRS